MTPKDLPTIAVALAFAMAAIGFAANPADAANPAGRGPGPELQKRFQEMDANADGSVTASEFQAHRMARFAAADANGDGKLSVEEIEASRRTQRVERITRMIAWHDRDGDGMLSEAEMPVRGGAMLMRLDADGDGAVSADEMRAGPKHGKPGHTGPRHKR